MDSFNNSVMLCPPLKTPKHSDYNSHCNSNVVTYNAALAEFYYYDLFFVECGQFSCFIIYFQIVFVIYRCTCMIYRSYDNLVYPMLNCNNLKTHCRWCNSFSMLLKHLLCLGINIQCHLFKSFIECQKTFQTEKEVGGYTHMYTYRCLSQSAASATE